jgi:hypothetical protein
VLNIVKCIAAHRKLPGLMAEGMAAVKVQMYAEDVIEEQGHTGTKAMAAKVEAKGADATLDRVAQEYDKLAADHPGMEREGDWPRLNAKRASFNGLLERLIRTTEEDAKNPDDLAAGHRKARMVALETELHDLSRAIRDLETAGPSKSEALWSGLDLGGA